MRPRISSIAVALSLSLMLLPTTAPGQEAGAGEADRMTAKTFEGLELRNIGPGLMSGRIADIAIHPDDPSVWYVAVGSGGVWKTVNRGTTWKPIFDDQGSYSIGCVTLDPNDPTVVWVGTGENVSGRHVGYGDGVYRSRDGGRTWTNVGLEGSEHIGEIVVDPRDSSVVLVAAEGPLWSSGGERGLYRSVDGGETWEAVLEIGEETGVTDVEIDPSDPDVIYAAAYQRRRKVWAHLAGGPGSGIYKSTDGGESWREVTTGLPEGDMGKIGLAVSPIRPSVVYATIEAHEDEAGFYRSDDRGESWTKRSSYLSGGTGPHYYQEIYASPHLFDRVYQADVWMHVTEDGGRTWERLGAPDKHSDNHALAFVPDDPDYLLAGTDGGLYETRDHADSWEHVSNLPVTQIYKMAVGDAEPFYHVIGGTQDNGTIYGPSRNASANGIQNRDWLVPYGADGYSTAIEPGNPDVLYVTWQRGHLLRYDRRTREALDVQPQPAPDEPPERWNWDAPLEVSPHSPTRIYYGSQRLWRSDDRGDSWTPISGDLSGGENRYELPMIDTVPGVSALYDNGAMSWYGNTTAISESPLQEGLIWVGTDDGMVQVTEDGGESWRAIDTDEIPGVPAGAFVNDIEASLHDADTVYAVFDHHKEGDFDPYLMVSTDRGRTWSSIVGDLPEGQILWSVVQDHVDPDLLFLGAEHGLWFTVDGGESWTELEGGVPTIAFRDIDIQRREDDLVAASFGRGFFVLDDYSSLREADAEALEAEARLFPVREALRFVPSEDLGGDDRAYGGSSLYMAPNPPHGALITYWLGAELESDRERRQEREAEMREAAEDVPFPGWETLREESRQEDPRVVLTVRNGEGEVVRRLTGPDERGFHRVAWDLRYPSPEPVDLDPGYRPPWAADPVGPMVAPGTYTVELGRLVDGELRPLGEPRSFEVRGWEDRALPAGDRTEVLAFQRRTAELLRRATSTSEKISEAERRLEHMGEALLRTPDAAPDLFRRLRDLEDRFADLALELRGDPVRSRLNEPSTPAVLGRLYSISRNHWRTTAPPTGTFRDSLEIATAELDGVVAGLVEALEALRSLEEDLEAAGAPWTPGRSIGTGTRS